jgi:O-acetyl-ADP-ribose deacetylase
MFRRRQHYDKNAARIAVTVADITTLNVQAIVNAANSRLIPGGGVDGAINRAAGPELAQAMMAIGGCPTGEAVVTPGFKLAARHVIHTVAPVFSQHEEGEVWRLLSNCYRNSLVLAMQQGALTVAFPSLGTGAYGIPFEHASSVALDTVMDHMRKHDVPPHVTFCCFSNSDEELFLTVFAKKNW